MAYFKKNNIKSIKLDGNKLIIKYNHKEEEKEPNTQELQQIKAYAKKIGKSELFLADLQTITTEKPTPTNYTPYILAGLGILAVIILGWLLWNKNKEK